MVNGQWWIAAASLISFFAGYALHGGMPQSQPAENPVAQVVEVQHDTIMQVQTVRDTIYETRVVTKYEPMLAKAEASPTFEEGLKIEKTLERFLVPPKTLVLEVNK